MSELAQLTAALKAFLEKMSREDWLGLHARAKAVEAGEAALAAERAEFAELQAAFKRKIAALIEAEAA
jgi:uncharacterized alpha-E superfamily protein